MQNSPYYCQAGPAGSFPASFFNLTELKLQQWNFTWYEDLFAQAAGTPSQVKVVAKAYRKVALHEPGQYMATLTYHNGTKTVANWTVRDIPSTRRAKNVVKFTGDGMTTNMITDMFVFPVW